MRAPITPASTATRPRSITTSWSRPLRLAQRAIKKVAVAKPRLSSAKYAGIGSPRMRPKTGIMRPRRSRRSGSGALRRRGARRGHRLLARFAQAVEQEQRDADGDRGVGDVEGRPLEVVLDVEVDEVDHVTEAHAIDHV